MGEMERLLFAYLQLRGQTTIRAGEVVRALRISQVQERKLLSRLAKAGWIARVQRGVYLSPGRLPLGGVWTPDPPHALNALMAEQGGRYQICGPNAFNRYGFDDQVPNRTYAYNDRLFGRRTIGAVELTLIRVAEERLGATEPVKLPDGNVAVYSSRTRTLVDAVHDWSRFGTLPRAFEWITGELRVGRVEARDLVDLTLRFGDVGTTRRIGALLARLGASTDLLAQVEKALKPTTSLIPWIPSRPKRGRVDRRWGIVWNGND